MRTGTYTATAWLFLSSLAAGQSTFPLNDVQDNRANTYAFVHAVIHATPSVTIPDGTLLVRKGMIEAAGSKVEIPPGAVIYDLDGKHIYPSFIDPYSHYGMPPQPRKEKNPGPRMQSSVKGAYGWNEALMADFNAVDAITADTAEAGRWREAGFGTVATHRRDGIMRGTSVAVLLGNAKENELVVRDRAAFHLSFNKGSSAQDYPSSLMGAIALIRQAYLDAAWYRENPVRNEHNLTLEALNRCLELPQVFEAGDVLSALRAARLGNEFGIRYILKGSGDEYRRIREVSALEASYIIPLKFPDAYELDDPYDALNVSLEQMMHWEMAPANPAVLEKYRVPFSFTAAGLDNPADILKQVLTATRYGLSDTTALKALTTIPAGQLGLADKLGTLEKGKIANFIITASSLFDKDNLILENWVKGRPYTVTPSLWDVRGSYSLQADGLPGLRLLVEGKLQSPEAKLLQADSTKANVALNIKDNLVTMVFDHPGDSSKKRLAFSGRVTEKEWAGNVLFPDGRWAGWKAEKVSGFVPDRTEKKDSLPVIPPVPYPFNGYGTDSLPSQETVLIRNATVWTCGKNGILNGADVLIRFGRIVAVGSQLSVPDGARVIDGTGMHVTPGIIDEHSHIAISGGVNEGTQSVTSEVRIGDVINSEDINIYRQLAGGVTTAHLLHGSANCIGGQTALVKLRWGYAPEKMKLEGAAPFIKFALGENVKQANWGDHSTIRFPQTRMGVEQVMYDAFIRAREYRSTWKKYSSMLHAAKKNVSMPRKDLELEALAEILEGKRFITCHSYVQSEINMMMKVADSMNFRLNTFTHVLEGYKITDKMLKHGAGASTFSDWWAYKYEVIDAVPYNAALLHRAGIITAINSDDAEMGRRLNQEAAKTVLYGDLTDEEALKLVTIHPAKLLHIDHLTGSIETEKDADLVLWDGNPLSVYSRAVKTFVDGTCFYDRDRDAAARAFIQKERMRLAQKMMEHKKNGGTVQKPKVQKEHYYTCDDLDGYKGTED